MALLAGPALGLTGIAFVLVAVAWALAISFTLLVTAAGVLSLAWSPGGSAAAARAVEVMGVVGLGLLCGGLVYLAGGCLGDRAGNAVLIGGLMAGSLLLAVEFGRPAAAGGHAMVAALTAGGVAAVGFGLSGVVAASRVFVLCA